MGVAMTLSALLVCVDEAAAQVLRQVLGELSIGVESCPDFARAAFRLAQERFDVVIVDGKTQEDVIALLRETRTSRLNDSTLAVAVVPSQDAVREIFSMGVNFVLYKPVTYDRALSSLRAARAVMRKEKRKNVRAAVHTHATIDYANVQQEKATLVNLAQDGMSVRFGKKLPPTSKVYFQFKLPGQNTTVRLSGLVVWQDWNGRAGVQFVDVPKTSRRLLEEFLEANLPTDIKADQLPDVTVEVEEPLQPVGVGTDSHDGGRHDGKHGEASQPAHEAKHEPTHTPAPKSSAHEWMPLEAEKQRAEANADRDNRRAQTRHTCRLGAEVYRTGKTVPNHCCLTDLSSGGCYLEVPLPFPSGSSVEILVRTHEMKLRLRGTVQASHPGYGMGVVFDLTTKELQDNVKKLLDFVSANS
jgi:DNA-binding NarL/FixJ family response regulator